MTSLEIRGGGGGGGGGRSRRLSRYVEREIRSLAPADGWTGRSVDR